MASGEKDLHILNDGADYLLPSGIQFAHDIIQQQNGQAVRSAGRSARPCERQRW